MIAALRNLLNDTPWIFTAYHVVKYTVIVLDVVLFILFLYALNKLLAYRPRMVFNPIKYERYIKKKKKPTLASPVIMAGWHRVQNRRSAGTLDALRLAIIEADGVVDELLRRMSLPGETFAERFAKLSREQWKSLEPVWEAHRLRNNLVHSPDFSFTSAAAEKAIAAYEAFLKEAKVI